MNQAMSNKLWAELKRRIAEADAAKVAAVTRPRHTYKRVSPTVIRRRVVKVQ